MTGKKGTEHLRFMLEVRNTYILNVIILLEEILIYSQKEFQGMDVTTHNLIGTVKIY